MDDFYNDSPYYFWRDGKCIELDEDEASKIVEIYCKENDLQLKPISEE